MSLVNSENSNINSGQTVEEAIKLYRSEDLSQAELLRRWTEIRDASLAENLSETTETVITDVAEENSY